MKDKMKELQEKCRELQEWLYENYDPHTIVIVDQVRAMLVSEQMAVFNTEIMDRK